MRKCHLHAALNLVHFGCCPKVVQCPCRRLVAHILAGVARVHCQHSVLGQHARFAVGLPGRSEAQQVLSVVLSSVQSWLVPLRLYLCYLA